MDILIIIFGMILLLVLQGFFSGSEIALVHADRLKLHHLSKKGREGANLVLKQFKKPEVLLGTTLVGTNLSLVALTTLGTILMLKLFGEYGDILAFLIFTPLFLIFGEVVPKSVYQQKADYLAPIIIYPLRFFSWLFYPVVFIFSWVARTVARIAGVKMTQRELFVNREQIRNVIEMAEKGANIDVFDRDRIMRVVRFTDVTVGDAMIPMAEMTTLGSHQTTQSAVYLARKHGHFRLPIYEGEHNQIIGVVAFSMWDLMDPEITNQPLSELIQPVHYVTPHQSLDELLPILQNRKDHMAIVVDEFGSAIGLITIEDIMEEIVGEVVNVGYTFESHLTRQKYHIQQQEDNSYLMDGRVPINEVCEVLEVSLSSPAAHTIGGLIVAHLRHIPTQGEYVDISGYRYTVEAATSRNIQTLRVAKIK